MPDGVKISELDQVASLTNQDIMPVCQPDAQSDTGFITKRCTMLDVAGKLFGDIQYTSQLNTVVKTGWGAINELKTDCDNADKKLADNAIVNIDGATFACFITNTLITFTIPLSNGLANVTNAEIYSLGNESFTIPNELTQGALNTLGDVEFVLLDGIGLVVNITNLVSTPTTTGASVAHCEEANILFTYVEPES